MSTKETETSSPTTSQASSADSPPLQEFMAQWLPALSEAAKRYGRWWNALLIIAIVLGLVGGLAATTTFFGETSDLAFIAIATGIAMPITVLVMALRPVFFSRLEEGKEKLIEEIQTAIEQHNLPSAEIVRGIAAEIEESDYRRDVMKAIDPDEAASIFRRDGILHLLNGFQSDEAGSNPYVEPIEQVSALQNYAYSCATTGFYAEAIHLLSTAELLYKAIAAATPEVQGQEGAAVRTAKPPWAHFGFRDQVSWLSNIVAQRKIATQALELLQAMTGQAGGTDLLDVDQGIGIEIRDKELTGKCFVVASMYGAAVFAKGDLDAIVTLSYVPRGGAILAYATSVLFDKSPFVPPLIEACIRRGAEMESDLVKLLRGSIVNSQFNAALALGIMRSAKGAEAARELLESATNQLTRIGALFILAPAGEAERQQEILPYLDDRDLRTAHAAALALEHLPLPVPDAVLEKHLRSKSPLVRLRLVRHVQRHTEVGPGVRDAVLELVTDEDDDVGMAAAETVTALLSGDALFDLAQDKLSGTEDRNIRRRLLLMAGRARTEAAVDLMLQEWEAVSWGTSDSVKKYANHILGCLSETQSVRVLPALVQALDKEDYKLPALMALMVVAQLHPEDARDPVNSIKDDVVRLFLLALLSNDADDVEAFKKTLVSATGDQRTLALQLAAVLAHPALEETLDDLRTAGSGNAVEKPTWRYLATQASFAVLMRKIAA